MIELTMFYRLIATFFYIGYCPLAPGTGASICVMVIIWILNPSNLSVIILFLTTFILGVISSERIEKKEGKSDPNFVVIDEVTGYLAALIFIPIEPINLFLALILFRFFDIVKPPPIRQIEGKLKGGIGIMIDDIIAGVFANLLIRVFLML